MSGRPRWYPKRLLDIGVQGDTEWKLIDTSSCSPASPSYMTLSYRWGSLPALKLTRSTAQAFHCGMPFLNLPQVYKDTVKVAHWFSVRYLWIDSLCIFQDSYEDWEKESSVMQDIYANSACNIAATASMNPEGGLFRRRRLEDVQPRYLRATLICSDEENYCIFDASYWDRQVATSPLHRRGWVFQECLLAPRVLHFGEDQILWECSMDRKCEAFPRGVPLLRSLRNSGMFSRSVDLDLQTTSSLSRHAFEFWNKIIESYSLCELTKPSDKLVALSGLAHLFQAATGQEYVAGVWKSRLQEFLDWRVYKPRAKVSTYCAPSWSWASIGGPVQPCGITNGSIYLLSVLDVNVSHSMIDPLGRVLSGSIVVKGLVIEISYHTSDHEGSLRRIEADGKSFLAHIYGDTLNTHFEDETRVYCLALKCYPVHKGNFFHDLALMGLLLHRESQTASEFSRIGHFHLMGTDSIEKFGIRISREKGSPPGYSTVDSSVIKIIWEGWQQSSEYEETVFHIHSRTGDFWPAQIGRIWGFRCLMLTPR